VKTGNGRGGDEGGWALVKKFIELAKTTNLVTVSPEQRARVLDWARRHTLTEPSGVQAAEAGEEQRAVHRAARSGAGQAIRVAGARRGAIRPRGVGQLPLPRATAAR
jgi:hypothetical protein